MGFPDPWKHTNVNVDTMSCDVTMTPSGICGADHQCQPPSGQPQLGFYLPIQPALLNANIRQIDGPDFLGILTQSTSSRSNTPVSNAHAGGVRTTGTVNPGVIYSADTWQIAVEAIIPINKASGRHVGVIAELHFFLDDIFPNSIGKPLFP